VPGILLGRGYTATFAATGNYASTTNTAKLLKL
jgi:hypothetical protein